MLVRVLPELSAEPLAGDGRFDPSVVDGHGYADGKCHDKCGGEANGDYDGGK